MQRKSNIKVSAFAFILIMMLIPALKAELHAREMPGEGTCEFRPPHQKRHHKNIFFGNPEVLKRQLNLSEEQIQKIRRTNDEYRRRINSHRKKIIPEKYKIRRLLLAEKVNLKEVKIVLKKISNIDTEIRFLKIKHRIDLEKILSKEQLSKLRSEKRHMRRKMRRGGFHGD